jgi:hypothetical protein
MECRDVVEAAVARLSGPLSPREERDLAEHVERCGRCAADVSAADAVWSRLGSDPDAPVTEEFRRDTLDLLRTETLKRRFARRSLPPILLRAAALLAVGVGGYALAKATASAPVTGSAGNPARVVSLAAERTIDASQAVPDLSQQPRLSNVSYRPADAAGRVGVSFDVTTRYNVVGRPDDRGVANVLAYIVSGGSGTEGARGRAIDLVSQHASPAQPPSPQIVHVLVQALRTDRNPGVRKKAAETLAGIPPTPEIRDAFVAALKSDSNPAVRMVAVENLAKMSTILSDPAAIETLREKATDSRENGFVRTRAAAALKRIDL